MMRDAITCDRPSCLALYLEPLDLPEGATTEDAARAVGWRYDETGHTCPGCAAGRWPTLERGECPVCTGATVDRADGATCHSCGTTVPHPTDDVEL
jgi:hypothetical protein